MCGCWEHAPLLVLDECQALFPLILSDAFISTEPSKTDEHCCTLKVNPVSISEVFLSCSSVLRTLAAFGFPGLSAVSSPQRVCQALLAPPPVLWPRNPRQSAGSREGFTSFVSHLSKITVLRHLMPNVFDKRCFRYFICVCVKGEGREGGRRGGLLPLGG